MGLIELPKRGLRARRWAVLAAFAALLLPAACWSESKPDPKGGPAFTLTVLHNTDGESQLVNAPNRPDFGGVARFATVVDQLRHDATRGKQTSGQSAQRGVVLLSSGDTFLAGPEFSASLRKGPPFYDSIAMKRLEYDARALGNHEFDFGPKVLSDFISGFDQSTPPFVAANLDFGAEPALKALVKKKLIATSTIVDRGGRKIGIVGATTSRLSEMTSPGKVKALPNVAELVQGEVDKLTDRGVNIVILVSHLHDLGEDRALVPRLRNVDMVIAGGGDQLLASDAARLLPGDDISVDPSTGQRLRYPLMLTDQAGVRVPVAAIPGQYKYVGRLILSFDSDGRVLGVDPTSDPVRVSGVAPDSVTPDPFLQANVVDPVVAFTEGLATKILARSEVRLEGRENNGIRTRETNLGDLLTDALLASARQSAARYGVTTPQVALQNGGGIGTDSLIPAGPLTEKDTFTIAPYVNFVAVAPNVPRKQFKEILENAVSRIPEPDGRFPQVAGLRFTYNPRKTAQKVDDKGNVLTPGERVRSVTLNDGTEIVRNGVVLSGATISVATHDFVARGGDQYPFRGLPIRIMAGLTYQEALALYLVENLGNVITGKDYPERGSGRIAIARE